MLEDPVETTQCSITEDKICKNALLEIGVALNNFKIRSMITTVSWLPFTLLVIGPKILIATSSSRPFAEICCSGCRRFSDYLFRMHWRQSLTRL